MKSQSVVALSSVTPRTAVRPPLLERRLVRFCPRLQPKIRALAARHTRLSDLAISFPALLFALAAPRQNHNPEPVIEAVIAGLPLATLAHAADLPLWTRALPPEAFTRAIGRLPDGDFVRRHIANHIPASTKQLPAWLDAVEQACNVGNEPIAVWIAGEINRDPRAAKSPEKIRRTCLWAWFSCHAETFAHTLIAKHWQPSMHLGKAHGYAAHWTRRVDLYVHLGDDTINDTWLDPATVDGFDFIPLLTAADIADEAAAMDNCLVTYGASLAYGASRIWSIRDAIGRVATLEVSQRGAHAALTICQIRSYKNADAPHEVHAAARKWLIQPKMADHRPIRPDWNNSALKPHAWTKLWRPYWLAKQRIPVWLPLRPTRQALGRLDC